MGSWKIWEESEVSKIDADYKQSKINKIFPEEYNHWRP